MRSRPAGSSPSRRAILVAALGGLAILAAGRAEADRAVMGLEAFGGWSRSAMREMNDSLQSFDRTIGTRFDRLHASLGYGFAVRLRPQERLLLRLAWEELPAETQGSGLEFQTHARAVLASVTWFVESAGPIDLGLSLGAGPWFVHGRFHGSDVDMKVSGSGFGGFVAGEAAMPVGAGSSVLLDVGWRLARVDPVKLEEQSMGAPADYSGPFLRLGISHDWGSF